MLFVSAWTWLCTTDVNAQTITIGSGTASNSYTGYPAPFGQYYTGCRHQILYKKAEMVAAGAVHGNLITQFGFNVTALNGINAMQGYTVKIGLTTLNSLSSFVTTGMTTVYTNSAYAPSTGWNMHTFTTPIAYDTSMNVIVEVCFNNGQLNYSYNASTQWTTGLTGTVIYNRDDYYGGCTNTAVTTSGSRPNGRFVMITSSPMAYSTTLVDQITRPIRANTVNEEVIKIRVVTTGTTSPLSVTQFDLNTNGTSNPGYITRARIYATGNNPVYDTNTVFGTVSNPSSSFSITGSKTLNTDTNYFWLAYNISGSATVGSVFDGECSSVTVGGTPQFVSLGAPFGNREIFAPLAGSYTVGTGQVYATIQDAFNDAVAKGISADVTFQLTDATYSLSSPVSILPFSNPSNKTITLRPGIGVTATISGSFTSALFSIKTSNVIFDGCNTPGLFTRDLTIVNNSTTTPTVLGFASSGSLLSNCAVRNCIITNGANTSSAITVTDVNTANAGLFSNFSVYNNDIRRSYIALYVNLTGASANISADSNVINAGSTNQSRLVGIYFQGVPSGTIRKNMIGNFSNVDNETKSGIWLATGTMNMIVEGNRISNIGSTAGNAGVGIRVSVGVNAANISVRNNMIDSIFGTGTSTFHSVSNPSGILMHTTQTGVQVVYNTIRMGGNMLNASQANSAGIRILAGATADVRNNYINNTQGLASASSAIGTYGIAVETASSQFTAIGHNNYYAGASGNGVNAVGRIGSTDYVTLLNWKTAVSADNSSYSENTVFTSSTDLHIPALTASQMEGGAVAISGVTVDFDGDPRSATTPDIGADEFNGTAADLTPPDIIYTKLSNTSSTTNRTLTGFANISDVSRVDSVANAPRFYYKKKSDANAFGGNTQFDNGWKYVSATNNTSPFSFTIDYNLLTGGAATPGDTIQYFVVAQDMAPTPNVTSSPSSGFSGTSVGVISSAPTTPNFFLIVDVPLAGVYTVGSGGNFATLTSAAASVSLRGVSAPVTFSLTDATYSTAETFPITFSQSPGVSATNTITVKPATGITATITGTSTTSIIKLDGSDYVILDGSNTVGGTTRDMAIINTNTNTSGNAVIWIASATASDGARNNTIKNCLISGNAATTTQFGIFGGTTTAIGTGSTNALAPNSNNTIQNNQLMKAQIGMWMRGPSSLLLDTANQVKNNDFGTATLGEGFNTSALIVEFQHNATVSKNAVQNITGEGGITNANGMSTVFTGLWIRQCKNATVSANRVFNLNYSAVGTTNRTHALYVESPAFNTSGNASNNTIVNNAIYDCRVSSFNPSFWTISGLSANGGYGDKFYFNSVNLTGTVNVTAGPAAAFSNGYTETTTASTNIDVRNNIFVINGSSSSGGGTFFSHYTTLTNYTGSTLNYNDLYSVATSGATAYIGFMGGVNQTALTDWRTVTAQEANSTASNPGFIGNNILIPSLGSAVVGTGTPITGITLDIVDSTRSNPPSMGAYDKARDLSGPSISYTAVTNANNTNNRTLTAFATITDPSGVNTTTGTRPRIYYKKKSDANVFGSYPTDNNVGFNGWKYAEATNTSSPFSFVIDYSILNGGSVSNGDTVQYFVVAQDNVATPNVGANPSAGFAATTVNNITAAPTTPSQYIIVLAAPMAGVYTVGAGGNYTTLTSAVGDLSLRGVSAAVTFNLTDASYSTAETFPILLAPYAGASATNKVTIQPSSANVVITGSAGASAVIKIADAKYYTIDGLNTSGNSLTLTAGNTGTAAVIWMSSTPSTGPGCNNIVLRNLTIKGASNFNNFGIVASVDGATPSTTGGADIDNITIANNSIVTCSYGICGVGTASVSAGGLDNWTITDNLIGPAVASGSDNITSAGIFLQNALNVTITGDSIRNVVTTSGNTGGIYLYSSVNRAVISRNTIRDVYSTASTSGVGAITAVYLGNNVINSRVSRNVIKSIASTTTNGYGVRAVILNTATNTSNDTIVNNTITDVWCYVDQDPIYWPIGIDVDGTTGGVAIYFNSVNIYGSHSGWPSAGGTTAAAAFYANTSGTNVDVRNNIFMDSYDNTLRTDDRAYAIYSVSAASAFSNLDYNNYYVSGPGPVLGYMGGADQTTLAALRIASTKDVHSVNVNVNFASLLDLHLAGASVGDVNLTGKSIPAFTVDIDGDTRATYPYMGADEVPGSPLPVTMVSFTAAGRGNDVQLTWSTASETNNKGFEVERSLDGANFELAGFVKGAGNSAVVNSYNLTDVNAFSRGNDLYYRLRQVDLNGEAHFSDVVKVSRKDAKPASVFSAYPNPFTTNVSIVFDASKDARNAQVELTDISGRVISGFDVQSADHAVSLGNLGHLQTGVYFVKVTMNGTSQVVKLIKTN